jgi:hypothetical protein
MPRRRARESFSPEGLARCACSLGSRLRRSCESLAFGARLRARPCGLAVLTGLRGGAANPRRPPPGQGSGPRAAPHPRGLRDMPRPWGAFHRRPDPLHTARPVKDRSTYPGSAATHEGRGGTLPSHGPPAHARVSSGTRVRRLSPGTCRVCARGPPAPRPPSTPSCPCRQPDRGGGRPAGARNEAGP